MGRGVGALKLATLRARALLVLWVEALLPAVWLPVALVCGFAAAALLGVFSPLPGWARLAAQGAALTAVAGSAIWGLLRVRPPAGSAADRRLEQDSGLAHRPLSLLRDRAATGDAGLWQAHLARTGATLTRLRVGGPRPVLAIADPRAGRALALLALLAGLAMAGPDAAGRLAQAFSPSLPAVGAAASVQGWIVPPAYTGLGPIFLSAGAGSVVTPAGSVLNLAVAGFRPHLTLGRKAVKFAAAGGASWQAQTVLTASGRLRLSRWWRSVGRWDVTVLPNDPPVLAWAGPAAVAGLLVKLPWQAAQRWGVASLSVELWPAARPDLPHRILPIPMPGAPKAASGTTTLDLGDDPWARDEVVARLVGRDVSGQVAAGPALRLALPQRRFHNQAARALVAIRRRLALDPEHPGAAGDDLLALASAPRALGGAGAFLNVVAVAALLRVDPHAVPQAEARLWTTALALDGALPDPSQVKLDRAQRQLGQALAGKNPSEIARRLQALRQAIAQRLQALARQAVKQGAVAPFDPNATHLFSPQIARTLREIERAIAAGRGGEAQQRLGQLQQMLDRLDHARIESAQQAAQDAAQNREGKQRMGAAADLAQREAGLVDAAQGPARDRAVARQGDAAVQGALARALQALTQRIAGSGQKVPDRFADAARAMGEAQTALQNDDDHAAMAAEKQAVTALQQGGRAMAQSMAKPGGAQISIVQGDDPGDQAGDEPASQGPTDPLGRPLGHGPGGADDGSTKVPDQRELGRSQQLQQELRRRAQDRSRRQEELDYIDRLLQPF